jgi:hypothetical protein
MSSTAGTGSKTSIPNEQKMAGSLCYSIVTRSDVSLTRRVSFFLNAIFLRVHCVESNDICVCISARSPEIEHFLSRPRFGQAIQAAHVGVCTHCERAPGCRRVGPYDFGQGTVPTVITVEIAL